MKTALFVIALLAAGLGLGRTVLAQQKVGGSPATLSWGQLARHAGLMGLQAKTQDEFRVDVIFASPKRVLQARAKIELTAAEWARFTNGKGESNLDFFSYWFYGKPGYWQRRPIEDSLFSEGKVDVSKIPAENNHICVWNKEAGQMRLYILVPGEEGKAGSLFYFFHILKLKAPEIDESKSPFNR